jgi:hypothetical protein
MEASIPPEEGGKANKGLKIVDMSRGKQRLRVTEIKRTVTGVTKAGLTVKSVRVNEHGELIVDIGPPGATPNSTPEMEMDRYLSGRYAHSAQGH